MTRARNHGHGSRQLPFHCSKFKPTSISISVCFHLLKGCYLHIQYVYKLMAEFIQSVVILKWACFRFKYITSSKILSRCRARKWLDLRRNSITIPGANIQNSGNNRWDIDNIVEYREDLCSHFYWAYWILLCLVCAVLIDMCNRLSFTIVTGRATFTLLKESQCVSQCDATYAIVAALWCHRNYTMQLFH